MRKEVIVEKEVLSSLCKNFEKAYNIEKPCCLPGRPKKISMRVGNYLASKFNKCDTMSLREGKLLIKEISKIKVSKQTVMREFQKRELNCRIRQKKPYMNKSQLLRRKKFYLIHKKINYDDFKKYIFLTNQLFT
jgi:hypothetical protein